MAELKKSDIADTNIKLRWREPYVSEGVNIQNTANSPGVYRGAHVKETTGAPTTSFRITKDTDDDTFVLFHDSSNGITTAVRISSDVTIDMSTAVTWPISGDQSWYVWMEIVYVTSSDTTGEFVVSDTAPTGDEVMIARIDMLNGDTTIQDERVRTDASARQWSFRKKIITYPKMHAATGLSSATYFQITGKVFIGNNAVSPYNRYVRLCQQDSGQALVGSDDRLIGVAGLYKDSGLSNLVLAADVDDDGFYDSPYVKFDFSLTTDSNYSGAVDAWYYGNYHIDEIPVNDTSVEKHFTEHCDYIDCGDITGSPNEISAAKLQVALKSIMDLLNSRYRHQNAAPPSSWTLLWRNEDQDDGNIDEQTVSFYYWSSRGFAITKGGYLSGASNTFYVNGNGGGDVSMYLFGNSGSTTSVPGWAFYYSASATQSDSWTYYTTSNWDVAQVGNPTGLVIDGKPLYSNAATGVGNDLWKPIILGTSTSGMFIGTSANDVPFALTYNCYWDVSTGEWSNADVDKDSFLLTLDTNGIKLFKKDEDSGDNSWTDAQWTSEMTLLGTPTDATPANTAAQSAPVVDGDLHEVGVFASSWQNESGGTVTNYVKHHAYNYRSVWNTAPNSISDSNIAGNFSFSDVPTKFSATWEKYGFYIVTDWDSVTDGSLAYSRGYWYAAS